MSEAPKRIWAARGLYTAEPGGFSPERTEYILAPEHDRLMAEKTAEIEAAYARGYHDCQERGITEGRLVIVDSPELTLLRAEIARLRAGVGALLHVSDVLRREP